MSQKLLVILDAGTPPQRDAITEFLKDKEWETWHWIDDAWILTDVPDEVSPRQIWIALIEIPILKPIKGIVLKIDADPTYWGGNSQDAWVWLAQHFGRADYPPPQAIIHNAEGATQTASGA